MKTSNSRAQDRKTAFKARQARIIATQSRPGLNVGERLVIATIGPHENLSTGQCNPGIDTLARESGLHERAIYRAIAGAERKGALIVTRAGNGGRNRPNGYQLVPPKGVGNPDNLSGKKTLTKRSRNPDTLSPELGELRSGGNATHSPPLGRKSEPSVRNSFGSGAALEGPPEPLEEPERHVEADPGSTSPRGQRREDDPAAHKTLLHRNGKLARPSTIPQASRPSALGPEAGDGVHAGWRALRELWAVRPWPITPRELAIGWAIFVKLVVAEGVPLDAILAGAGAWVRGVDDPRYLMALPQWLAAHGWEHSPPPKRMRQAQGRGARREKTDLASLMHQLGQTM
jgi:hypothetical protein